MSKHRFRFISLFPERIIVCWYALTKKHYGFFSYDREVKGHSGSRCYIEDGAEHSKVFLGALRDYANVLLDKMKEDKNEGNQI